MELSVLIAKTLGLVYVVFGLGLLINGAYYKKAIDEMLKTSAFMFFGGVMSLVLGFLIVNAHNVWVKDWTVLVTIIGWIALVKGLVIFLAPKFLLDFSRPFLKNIPVIGVGAVILGGVFCYFGFFA